MRSKNPDQLGMVLERVVALEPVDAAQNLQVPRLGIDAEPAGVRDRLAERRFRPEPPRVPRDRRDLTLHAGDDLARQEAGQVEVTVAGHPRGQRGPVHDEGARALERVHGRLDSPR